MDRREGIYNPSTAARLRTKLRAARYYTVVPVMEEGREDPRHVTGTTV